MFIRIGFDIAYSFPQPTEIIMMLYTHPSRSSFLMIPERLSSDPHMVIEHFIDVYGNQCARAWCPGGTLHLRNDAIVVDGGLPDIRTPDAKQHTIHELPTDTLLYLLGSRYCEIEKLSDIAWNLFGHGPAGWGRVQAICDWVHNHITFAHESARCDRTAYDTFLDQRSQQSRHQWWARVVAPGPAEQYGDLRLYRGRRRGESIQPRGILPQWG